ncbi:MAG: glycosyltransferase family 2 protein [Candidatus Gracilibacteria bacterium]|jgi:abequosyltransferase
MEISTNKIFLSFAIPTYNRAVSLTNLLNNILPQIKGVKDNIEICISDNGSSDNTKEVVMDFKKKYPCIIKYNRNEKDIGFEKNILKLIEMSEGEFIWLFGDDDLLVNNGFKEIINFIKNNAKENTALLTLREEAYFFDEKTGKKTIYHSSFEPGKPSVYEISRENVITEKFPCCTFISALIFKGSLFKTLLLQEHDLIKKAIGLGYIHTFLYRLMFIKFSDVKAITLNKIIISQEMALYKFYIEGKFTGHYVFPKKSNNLLLSSGYMADSLKEIFLKEDKKFRTRFIQDIILTKTFKGLYYFSYIGVLKMFFRLSNLRDAVTFSFLFFIMSLIPPIILQNALKVYFLLKYKKKWKNKWLFCYVGHFKSTQGTRIIS